MDIKHIFAALEISRVSKMLKKATQISKVKNQHTSFYFKDLSDHAEADISNHFCLILLPLGFSY